MSREQNERVEVDQAVEAGQGGGGRVGAVEGEVDPADVVVGEGIAHGQHPLLGLPQAQVAGGVPGGADDLPVGVAEAEDLLRRGVARRRCRARPAGRGTRASSSRDRGGRAHRRRGRWPRCQPHRLEQRVAADVVGVPVGVDDQVQVPGVRVDPRRRLLGVADEAAVDERRLGAVQQQQVGVGERPLLPGHPAPGAARSSARRLTKVPGGL